MLVIPLRPPRLLPVRVPFDRRVAWVVALALAAATSARAQESERGSRVVDTGHWAYEYLTRLRDRGYLTQLDPLARPYHQVDIVQALSPLDPDTLPAPVAGWVRLLRSAFRVEHQAWGAVVLGGVRAASTDRLDPVRPAGAGGAWPYGAAGVWVEGGHLAAETRVLGDLYESHDPELIAPNRPLGVRVDHSYVSATVPHAFLALGRIAHDWGPAGAPGLLISDHALPYPQIAFEGSFGRFRFQGLTAQLDTLGGANRYLSAQRLAYVSPRFAIAAADAILYSGPNRSPSFALLDPVAPLVFEYDNSATGREDDLLLALQAWYRLHGLVLDGEFMLDDVDISPPAGQSRAPMRYAFDVGARLVTPVPWLELAARYTQVSAFAYRSYDPGDQYDYLGRGLADNFADHDHLRLSADLFPPLPGLTLTPTFEFLRQGEGDFRIAMPDMATFRQSARLFLGVVEQTARIGLRGRYQPTRYLWLTWDVGQDQVRNADHVTGRSRSEFVALGQVGFRIELGAKPH